MGEEPVGGEKQEERNDKRDILRVRGGTTIKGTDWSTREGCRGHRGNDCYHVTSARAQLRVAGAVPRRWCRLHWTVWLEEYVRVTEAETEIDFLIVGW